MPGRLGWGAVAWVIAAIILLQGGRVAGAPEGDALPEGPAADPVTRVELLDETGQACTLGSFRGSTVLAHFIFTRCPAACPAQVDELKKLRASLPPALAERVRFVSLSIDPEHDSPETMRAFAEKMGIDTAHWTLLTGARTNLAEVARALGDRSSREKPAVANDLPHDLHLYLFDADGRFRQRYAGSPLDQDRLREEIAIVDRLFNPR